MCLLENMLECGWLIFYWQILKLWFEEEINFGKKLQTNVIWLDF